MTKGFTDDDLRNFSDFIAKLPPPPASADAGRRRRACSAASALITAAPLQQCHDLDLSGNENVPRIAGAARGLSRSRRCANTRATPGTATKATMAEVLAPITDAQIVDLAYTSRDSNRRFAWRGGHGVPRRRLRNPIARRGRYIRD